MTATFKSWDSARQENDHHGEEADQRDDRDQCDTEGDRTGVIGYRFVSGSFSHRAGTLADVAATD